MINTIDAIISALERVETHGRNNMDALLGSIQALERLRDALSEPVEQEEETDG